MKFPSGRILAVLLAAVLVVGGANLAAYAANGSPLLLGKNNKATKVTKLKNSKGTALSLKSKTGTAPLQVSSNTKVTNLNADLIDGADSSALQTKSFTYTLSAATTTSAFVFFALNGLPAGKYIVSYNVPIATTGGASGAGCFVLPAAPGVPSTVPISGVAPSLGGAHFVTGSGFVDTTTQAMRFGCQRLGGTDMTIPPIAQFQAYITFTRVDDNTTTAVVGTPAAAPRGADLLR